MVLQYLALLVALVWLLVSRPFGRRPIRLGSARDPVLDAALCLALLIVAIAGIGLMAPLWSSWLAGRPVWWSG